MGILLECLRFEDILTHYTPQKDLMVISTKSHISLCFTALECFMKIKIIVSIYINPVSNEQILQML